MAITERELGWTAGFLEGEGSFLYRPNAGLRIFAVQVHLQPLHHLQALFGGRIYLRKAYSAKSQRASVWQLNGPQAIGLTMTLYGLMSPKRREQIRIALGAWRARRPWNRDRGRASCGHELTPDNVAMSGPYRRCRMCRDAYLQTYNVVNRERLLADKRAYYRAHKDKWRRSRPTSPPRADT